MIFYRIFFFHKIFCLFFYSFFIIRYYITKKNFCFFFQNWFIYLMRKKTVQAKAWRYSKIMWTICITKIRIDILWNLILSNTARFTVFTVSPIFLKIYILKKKQTLLFFIEFFSLTWSSLNFFSPCSWLVTLGQNMAPRVNFLSSGCFKSVYITEITNVWSQWLLIYKDWENVVASAAYSRGPELSGTAQKALQKNQQNLNKSGSGAVESAVSRSHGHHSCCAISSWMFLHHTSNRPNTSRREVF